MIQSWRFINGERIMFPTNSHDAEHMGWQKVKHNFNETSTSWDTINTWLHKHVQDRAYYLGPYAVYFYRESDATMFVLKWEQ